MLIILSCLASSMKNDNKFPDLRYANQDVNYLILVYVPCYRCNISCTLHILYQHGTDSCLSLLSAVIIHTQRLQMSSTLLELLQCHVI